MAACSMALPSEVDLVALVVDERHVTLPARVDSSVSAGVIAVPRNLKRRPAETLLGEDRVFGPVKLVKA